MNIVADLHIHTVASGHAFSTISEITEFASKNKLQAIGISDHSVAMPEGAHDYYFSNLKAIPRKHGDLEVYRGAEVNIIDKNGNLDLHPETQVKLDYLIASMHSGGVSPEYLSVAENTAIWEKVMENPYVKILGHPGNPKFPINIERFVYCAKINKKIVELNNGSFIVRQGSEKNIREIISEAINQKVYLIISSDAHFASSVGKVDKVLSIVREMKVPEELIINTSLKKLKRCLEFEI